MIGVIVTRSLDFEVPPCPMKLYRATMPMRFRQWIRFLVIVALWLAGSWTSLFAAPPVKLPVVEAEAAGMNPDRLAAIDRIVKEGLLRENMPGAVVVVGHQGQIAYQKAFGFRELKPNRVPMTVDTVFDLASLTKPIATATSVMKLIESKQLQLHEPVKTYFLDFAQNGKDGITVFHLLTHQSGLIPDNALKDYEEGLEKAWERVCGLKPLAKPGERFLYSDVNFIVLGKLIEEVTGQRVHEYSRDNIFKPLGLTETGYLPSDELRQRAAVTQEREGRWMRGEVHDPRAYLLEGVAGHAGLFSTASDLAVYAQMMIERGSYQGVKILSEPTAREMTKAYEVPGGLRGLGWDKKSSYSSNRGDLFSEAAFGHGGFTGTAIWIDPEQELFVIFLSNRVHPDGKGSVNPLAGRIGTIAAAAINPTGVARP